MSCCCDKDAIKIVRGNDTNFNDQVFLTLNLKTTVLDLANFSAAFTLGEITKTFDDLSSGYIVINYSAEETLKIPYGFNYGVLKLFDNSKRVATIESKVPFEVIALVSDDAIATKPYTLNFDVEQGGENILNVSIEAGVSVEVGTTTTLPAGSHAVVTNSGTPNHLILDFGIPEGDGIISVEKTSSEGLVDIYTITWESGKTSTFEIENGNGIESITKTSTSGLVDTYTISFTNGTETTFEVTNGNGISSIEKTSSEDLVDTYTIYYTNGDSTTFTVTNGKDATINGVNALNLTATDGLTLSQSDDVATISGNTLQQGISDINALIPEQASPSNQLADKGFVNSTVQTGTANFRGNWADWADVPTSANDYPVDFAGNKTPTVNDYLVVQDASDYSGETLEGTWRFKYSGEWIVNGKNGWLPEYQVNETPLTAAQLAALNSGATTENITQITTNKNAIGTLSGLTTTDKSSVVGAVNELNNSKQNNITGAASTITTSNLTANRALISNASGKVAVSPVTNTELNYLSGTTSNIQTQINNANAEIDTKIDKDHAVNDILTNGISYIPQDIKLELSNGTLTLKSGSVLTKPNGTQIIETEDKTYTQTGSDSYVGFVLASGSGNISGTRRISDWGSGSSLPADGSTYNRFFNTTNLKFYRWINNNWEEINQTFPLCVCTVTSGVITSIDQVFNGAGYIGQSKFLLPGVKVLAANGFNSDGTLKSIERTNNSLQIVTQGGTYNRRMFLNGTALQITSNNWHYDEDSNLWYDQNDTILTSGVVYLGDCFTVNDVVTKFSLRQVSILGGTAFDTAIGYTPENSANKVTSISGSSTDTQYPSAKLLYDTKTAIESSISTTNTNVSALDEKKIDKGYAVNDFATNCITEIPQDIKLELSSGTLTLKSGSIITYPDGTQKTTASDLTASSASNGKKIIYANSTGSAIIITTHDNACSGTTDSLAGTGWHVWYDTTNNTITQYAGNGTSIATANCSFPVCICTVSNGAISSIDQVFNGAGYIGHHLFALPGIKVLTPRGFNTDGTLKTVSGTNTTLNIQEMTGSHNALCLNDGGTLTRRAYKKVIDYDSTFTGLQYVRSLNKGIYNLTYERDEVPVLYYSVSGTNVLSFEIPPISGLSGSYIETTLGYTPLPNNIYGVSTTAAATVQKEVSIPSITSLNVGQLIIVQPSVTSTVANSTLKLNSFSAYPMLYNGAAITTTTDSIVWNAACPTWFLFDGTNWVFMGHGVDTNTTYSAATTALLIAGTNTANRVIPATVFKDATCGVLTTFISGDTLALDDKSLYTSTGDITALTLSTPTVDERYLCQVNFTSGTTATTLTYPSAFKVLDGCDDVQVIGGVKTFVPVSDKRYQLFITSDGVNTILFAKGV